jgi:D-alanyl-D-alanine carboxypeptidase (penicillin-binding protein 5/6)
VIRWGAHLAGALLLASAGASGAGATPATQLAAAAQLAALPARAMVLIQEGSGAIAYARDANAELPIASTTKLMTAYVTLTHEPLDAQLVEQPYDPTEGESLAPVPAGTRLSVTDMLRAMLLPSGNNVAYSLSIDVGGTESGFVAMMNAAAAKLHLGRTHYTTPVGLDVPAGNYSTADDLARLARVLMRRSVFRGIVDEPSATLTDGIVVTNRNDLVGTYPWVVGIKTGNTADAGECLVGAARLHGVRLISVVLGTPSESARDTDTLALLRYGLSIYRSVKIAVAGQTYASIPVAGRSRPARLIARTSSTLVLARSVQLHAALEIPTRLQGPIAAGTVEGAIEVTEDGRTLEAVSLVTAAAVPSPPLPLLVVHAATALAGVIFDHELSGTSPRCSVLFMRTPTARCAPGMQR